MTMEEKATALVKTTFGLLLQTAMRNIMWGRVFFFLPVLLYLLYFCGFLPTPISAAKSGGEVSMVKIETTRWKNFLSPQGRFEVKMLDGWIFKAYAPDESSFGFTPQEKDLPAIDISFTEANIMAMSMGLPRIQQITQKLTPEGFFQGVFLPLYQQKIPDLKVESLSSKGQAGELITSGTYMGKRLKMKVLCTIEHVYDPTMPTGFFGTGGWYNLAQLKFITASPQEIASVEPIAAGIFASFRPNPRWMGEVLNAIQQGIMIRTGMISETISRINTMEMQQRMREMESTTRIGKGWADALGGTTELKDPSTGDIYRVNDQWKYYYQGGGEIYGTNDPFEPKGPGWIQLEGVR